MSHINRPGLVRATPLNVRGGLDLLATLWVER
jgi:hypothetical protein